MATVQRKSVKVTKLVEETSYEPAVVLTLDQNEAEAISFYIGIAASHMSGTGTLKEWLDAADSLDATSLHAGGARVWNTLKQAGC